MGMIRKLGLVITLYTSPMATNASNPIDHTFHLFDILLIVHTTFPYKLQQTILLSLFIKLQHPLERCDGDSNLIVLRLLGRKKLKP
ncbi:hypothetical protein D3C78_1470150 [compost metagenome]